MDHAWIMDHLLIVGKSKRQWLVRFFFLVFKFLQCTAFHTGASSSALLPIVWDLFYPGQIFILCRLFLKGNRWKYDDLCNIKTLKVFSLTFSTRIIAEKKKKTYVKMKLLFLPPHSDASPEASSAEKLLNANTRTISKHVNLYIKAIQISGFKVYMYSRTPLNPYPSVDRILGLPSWSRSGFGTDGSRTHGGVPKGMGYQAWWVLF